MAKSNLETVCATLRDEIKAAEQITRTKLPEAVNRHMELVLNTGDVRPVNSLIEVLTPMNTRAAVLFFAFHLPFIQEKDAKGEHVRFGKMMERIKDKNKRLERCEEWLKNEGNFWQWVKDNTETSGPPDYLATFDRALANALKGNKNGEGKVEQVDIIQHFLAVVDADTITKVMTAQMKAAAIMQALKPAQEPEEQQQLAA